MPLSATIISGIIGGVPFGVNVSSEVGICNQDGGSWEAWLVVEMLIKSSETEAGKSQVRVGSKLE
jgi:hypothetical protein